MEREDGETMEREWREEISLDGNEIYSFTDGCKELDLI
jgi:hypothetical protein